MYLRYVHMSIYAPALITKSLVVPITNVGKQIQETLESIVKSQVEGKCIVEGFVKPGSVKVLRYSSGNVHGSSITFEVVYECEICCPVEGMLIRCVAMNNTKAGIRAETTDKPSPLVIFVARDHHYHIDSFSTIEPGEEIQVRVIGQRFELNDTQVSVIAELVTHTAQEQAPAQAQASAQEQVPAQEQAPAQAQAPAQEQA